MQQTTLDLDDAHDSPPPPDMTPETPERQQRLLTLMAEAIIAVWQSEQENDHEER